MPNGCTASGVTTNPASVHMADATNSDVVSYLGIKSACLVTITIPDPRSVKEIIHNMRTFSPESRIVARSRYHIASQSLMDAGADAVVDEENTTGDKLAEEVMKAMRDINRDALGCALAGEKP